MGKNSLRIPYKLYQTSDVVRTAIRETKFISKWGKKVWYNGRIILACILVSKACSDKYFRMAQDTTQWFVLACITIERHVPQKVRNLASEEQFCSVDLTDMTPLQLTHRHHKHMTLFLRSYQLLFSGVSNCADVKRGWIVFGRWDSTGMPIRRTAFQFPITTNLHHRGQSKNMSSFVQAITI
jgi:hypothetical protein